MSGGAMDDASDPPSPSGHPTGDAERTAILAFESDAWIDRAARAAEPAIIGEIAGYRLVRVVARGAQGTVYEAIEPRTGRRVAIKRLMRGDAALGDGPAEPTHAISLEDTRFARETSVLAALAHPNIVSLLSAPESDGARLLVMEWIEGESFDRWADAVWSTRGRDDALETIVRALVDAARAISVAHAIGIVHRDIKPTNILVGAGDAPKVLDFGLAKEFDAVDATRTQGFAGTPSWCAPEQIDGRPEGIDARTDVHALGLLAYRALTGRAAFDGSLPIGTLFERIRHEVPAFRAEDRARVPSELALVILRALEKDPARRYANASALADDLERFLAGEPVEAHPPGTLYVARTLVRRHRTATIGLLAAFLALAAGGAASLLFAIDATRARNAEAARADEAEEARLRAERMNGYFRDLLANLREQDAAGTPTTAAEIVKLAVRSLETSQTPPELERDLRATLAEVLFEIGDYAGSAAQFERLVGLQREAVGPPERARALIGLARARQLGSQSGNALLAAEQAIAVLDGSVSKAADELRSSAYGLVAVAETSSGKGPAALAAADQALRFAEASGLAPQRASALSTRALALDALGNREAAAEAANEAVRTARGLELPLGEWSRLLHNAGYLALATRRYDEALAHFDETLEVRRREHGERHPRTMHTEIQRALALRGLTRHDEAIDGLVALAAAVGNPGDDASPAAASSRAAQRLNILRHLGSSLEIRGQEGDRARAIDAYGKAVEMWFEVPGNTVSRLTGTAHSLVRLLALERGEAVAVDQARALLARVASASGRAEHTALLRAVFGQRLAEAPFAKDAWRSMADTAQCRDDARIIAEHFGARSAEAFEGEFMLLLALERSDEPSLVAEAASLRASIEKWSTDSFGENSDRVRRLMRSRPALP
ncbi:MAG: protein kinase [Phycisphaera sp.]|nr:protein kinase [Phycisphaera sp.]